MISILDAIATWDDSSSPNPLAGFARSALAAAIFSRTGDKDPTACVFEGARTKNVAAH